MTGALTHVFCAAAILLSYLTGQTPRVVALLQRLVDLTKPRPGPMTGVTADFQCLPREQFTCVARLIPCAAPITACLGRGPVRGPWGTRPEYEP
jgi:hypothetical protein